ncbi:hypothetical protein AB0F81_08085 [Actinoplanes sp. NPDC024001]|uniref:hypothetical protein n=1 Tax=Actinoplanes sp. NPDC024001 TaxID=3154598 RepID=UPI0034015703
MAGPAGIRAGGAVLPAADLAVRDGGSPAVIRPAAPSARPAAGLSRDLESRSRELDRTGHRRRATTRRLVGL